MKSRILIVLLFALSSCGSPEYEKAIADWLQTDENGTWTDLKFELIELLDEKDVTTRVRDKDCVKNRVKRAKIVRFTLC